MALVAAGCGVPKEAPRAPGLLPTLLFDDELGFFGTPFPSDARRAASGAPDCKGLPNPEGIGFVKSSVESAYERDGFDPSGAVYFRFDRELPVPTRAPADTRVALRGIEIVDVDPRSPERLTRYPAWVQATARHDGVRPPHLLRVLPLPGVARAPRPGPPPPPPRGGLASRRAPGASSPSR
jgi:hypothetical protein